MKHLSVIFSWKSFSAALLSIFTLCAFPLLAQTGFYTLDGGTATQSGQTFAATQTDQSAVLVLNAGALTLNTCTMTKSGDSSSVNNSSQYGTNAGILATSGSTITMTNSTVNTTATGANGLFATGANSVISMNGGTISAVGYGSHGVDCTYGGAIHLTNVDVYTNGGNSSALATDFGGGIVSAYGGTIASQSTATNSHSAGLYSTGYIAVVGATVSSAADCGGVIDGANSIHLINTNVIGATKGFKIWKTAPATGSAILTVSGGTVTSYLGSTFYVTGETGNPASADISISGGAELDPSNGNLIEVLTGSTANFTIVNCQLNGNLYADATSTLTTIMQDGSHFLGTTTNCSLTINSGCTWILSGDSHLKIFSDMVGISGTTITNITGNWFHAYYDGTLPENAYLNNHSFTLVGGGWLLPEGAVSNDPADGTPALLTSICCSPNPFRAQATLSFSLKSPARAKLSLYNLKGEFLAVLFDADYTAGSHEFTLNTLSANGLALSSGTYFAVLSTPTQRISRRIVYCK